MAAVYLTCQHPALVTHMSGDRLIECAVPGCDTTNVVHAREIITVAYTNRTAEEHDESSGPVGVFNGAMSLPNMGVPTSSIVLAPGVRLVDCDPIEAGS